MKSCQALLAVCVCAVLPLHAADLSDLIYTTTDVKVTITDCKTAASGELVIPDTIEGKPVTSIGGAAFWGCASLTSITIPDSVTSIGGAAFSYSKSLTNITISDSVNTIGERAFSDCRSLTSITIPDSVTSIGRKAFSYCTNLTSITIPDSVTSIGGAAFWGCASLTSITIPDSVTSIGSGNFYGCTSLTSITIPNSVTSIEFNAFLRCTNLTSITIPDSVTSIRLGAFVECTSLTAVIFLGDAPKEGKEVFKDSVPTIYRKPEAKGWGDTFAERPVKLISSEALVVLIEREVELAQFDSALSLIDSFLLKYPDDPKVDEIKTLRGRINKFQQLEDFSE